MSLGNREKHINTDVLVIGGGMAGIFASIKAKEQGCDVTLADKGYVGKTSGAHFAEGDVLFFRPERGHKLEEWVNEISEMCEYINNPDWDKILLEEAEARYNDLVSWRIKFYEENGQIHIDRPRMGDPVVREYVSMANKKYAPALRKKALEDGIRVLDRIMVCELLKQDGKVVGAIGFHTTSGDLYIFNAGAVVIATGGVGQLKASGSNIHYYTGDGDAMAYRAGAEITGKEFGFWAPANRALIKKQLAQLNKGLRISGKINDVMERFPFVSPQSGWPFPNVNAEGEPIAFAPWEVHCGRGPIYADMSLYPKEQEEWVRRFFRRVGTAEVEKLGLDISIKGKWVIPAGRGGDQLFGGGCGIWPINTSCATAVPGLFAAGNSCATRGSGARYGMMGFGLNHAMVTGTRAGVGAAEYAATFGEVKVDEAELMRVKKIVYSPVERHSGFSPGWLTRTLQGLVTPYFITQVKHRERLQPALKLVEFLNRHLVPKLWAKDAHEWRMAQETRNMVLDSEMVLRASLFRTESRGGHFREDYPRREDPTWLAWVKLKEEHGDMKVFKEAVPKKWWPDLSKPYEERYPFMFPLE
jgi:succinate dehydrogenase/fumarate reductase flavoprotein subunit